MIESRQVHDDITVLPTFHEIPAVGVLTINCFVLHAEQPMIIDTGTTGDSEAMVAAIEAAVDPAAVRWLWITHTDADHIGSVHTLLERCPNLTVVTTYTGMVKMGTHAPIPLHRIRLLNPGESLDLGDREITAVVPPLFDAPETTGFHDPVSGALFSSDCFGAILPSGTRSLDDMSVDELRAAQALWTSIDTPWVRKVDRHMLAADLDGLRALDSSMILSAHLPATVGMVEQHLDGVQRAPDAPPFAGIAHRDFAALLSGGRPPDGSG